MSESSVSLSTETVTSLASVLSADSAFCDDVDLVSVPLEDPAPEEKKQDAGFTDEDMEPPVLKQTEEWPRRQVIWLFLIGILCCFTTNFPSAFTHTSVNTAYTSINRYLNASFEARGKHLEPQDFVWLRSIINVAWYAGQTIGAVITPFVTDRFGRKPAYLISTFAMTFACALQSGATLVPYPELLIAGRVLASIFSPMSDAAAILYLQEVSPVQLRGTLSSLFSLTYSIMGLIGMILGQTNVLGAYIHWLLFVPVIPGCLSLFMLLYFPETPKFLKIVRHNDKGALKSIQFYQGVREDNYQTLENYAREGNETDGSILDLFRKSYLRHALISNVMCTVPVLAFYPVLQSSTFLLKKLTFEGNVAEYSSTILMVLLICCCVVAAFNLDRYSRRKLFRFTSLGATLSLIIFSIAGSTISFWNPSKYFALAGLFGYIIFYGFGLGPISFFIGTELVPLQYRSSMFSVSFCLNNVAIVLTSLCVQPAYQVIGSLSFLILFVLPNIFAITYVNANLPETKNREIDQIVEALRRRTGFFRRNVKSVVVKGVVNPAFKKDKHSPFIVTVPFSTNLDA